MKPNGSLAWEVKWPRSDKFTRRPVFFLPSSADGNEKDRKEVKVVWATCCLLGLTAPSFTFSSTLRSLHVSVALGCLCHLITYACFCPFVSVLSFWNSSTQLSSSPHWTSRLHSNITSLWSSPNTSGWIHSSFSGSSKTFVPASVLVLVKTSVCSVACNYWEYFLIGSVIMYRSSLVMNSIP